MSRMSRDKGARIEREIVELHRQLGLRSDRDRRLQGLSDRVIQPQGQTFPRQLPSHRASHHQGEGRGVLTDVLPIASIVMRDRHRKDMGDIRGLAESIRDVGLLQPIVVRPDNVLIAGARRLAACAALGWSKIPVTVVDLAEVARGEFAENVHRKKFTPSEMVAIAKALEEWEREAARKRHGGDHKGNSAKFAELGQARDKVAAAFGVSGWNYEKVKAVVGSGEADLVEEMDRTGNVHAAYKKLRRRERRRADLEIAAGLPPLGERCRVFEGAFQTAEIEPGSVDWVITDPPYMEDFVGVYADLARCASVWLRPGGSLLAMAGQIHLPEVLAALCSASLLYHYHWTIAYLTPGGQAVQIFPRNVNTFWKPVFWFVKGKYDGKWIGDVATSGPNDNDKRFHEWGQSESGFSDLIERFTRPGDVVCDPMMGGGTTGVVALRLGRKFVGIERDNATFTAAKTRLVGEENAALVKGASKWRRLRDS